MISDANDGDETFPMFYVRFGAFTTLLHASEFAPVAEAEAQLWACRQIDGPGADVDALRGRLEGDRPALPTSVDTTTPPLDIGGGAV